MGPLDYYNKEGDPVWNHGSARNWDGIYNQTASGKIDPSLVIDISDGKVREADFAGIPGYENFGNPGDDTPRTKEPSKSETKPPAKPEE